MSSNTPLFTAPVSRVLAATFGALTCSVVITAAMPIYLPFSQTDNIGIPILLFPLTWLLLFIYSLLSQNMWKVWILFIGLIAVHSTLIFLALT